MALRVNEWEICKWKLIKFQTLWTLQCVKRTNDKYEIVWTITKQTFWLINYWILKADETTVSSRKNEYNNSQNERKSEISSFRFVCWISFHFLFLFQLVSTRASSASVGIFLITFFDCRFNGKCKSEESWRHQTVNSNAFMLTWLVRISTSNFNSHNRSNFSYFFRKH